MCASSTHSASDAPAWVNQTQPDRQRHRRHRDPQYRAPARLRAVRLRRAGDLAMSQASREARQGIARRLTAVGRVRRAADRRAARVRPRRRDRPPQGETPKWKSRRRPRISSRRSRNAADGDLNSWIDDVRPPHPEYVALQKALADVRGQQAKGGWPQVKSPRQAWRLESRRRGIAPAPGGERAFQGRSRRTTPLRHRAGRTPSSRSRSCTR